LIVIVAAQIVLSRTTFGSHIIAIGSSEKSARLVGIIVKKRIFLLFVVSGVCGALAGIISVLKVGAVTPRTGLGFEFSVVAMLVLGGLSIFGGRGSLIPGAFLGVLLMIFIKNGLLLLSSDPYYFDPVTGIIMLIAAYTYIFRDKKELTGKRLIIMEKDKS